MEFKRPEFSLYPWLYPLIYSTFTVKVRGSDVEEEYYIQDLTENFFDIAVDFIVANHARGAVFHRAANTLCNDSGINRVREMYRNVFKEKISLICIKKDTNEAVGVGLNALHIRTKSDIPKVEKSDNKGFQQLTASLNFIDAEFSVFDHYKVERVMFAAGLCVDEKFRGRGIATEILKARIPLMQAIGIEVTTSVFSTLGAQKAAKAAGYDENYKVSYEALQAKFPEMDFSHGASVHGFCKVLSRKV